jgi:HD-GYP domain-containing protein (c-di-GMP phosphodiesterase class II)
MMKRHAEDGYQIVKNIRLLENMGITDMVRHHHERMDGKGYPLGLTGDEIPRGARILNVSDAFDAMTTNRSYKKKLPTKVAVQELQRNSGTQFDPEIVQAFLNVLQKENRLTDIEFPAGDTNKNNFIRLFG